MKQVSGAKHVGNLAIKFVFFTVVLAVLLSGRGGYTFGGVLWVAGGLAVLAYLIGDLWVLPNYGNWTAVVADGILAALGLWALPPVLGTPPIRFGTVAIAALLVAAGEYYFHRYLQGGLVVGSGQRERGGGAEPEAGNGPR